jgi:predicted AlkP superfamily pyrophosphatase or phosphodiesterase
MLIEQRLLKLVVSSLVEAKNRHAATDVCMGLMAVWVGMLKKYWRLAIVISAINVQHSLAAEPIVIILGIDGLRADTLDRIPTVNLQYLADKGVRANMIPAMPSKTFVNFYSLATGLYPEHHGMTSNYPYDRKMQRLFNRQTDVQDPRWWAGEPIWATAEKQGIKAAVYFWVGSEAPVEGQHPSFWKPYQQNKDYAQRVAEVLTWLSLPEPQKPRLIMLYFSAVDTAAHDFGVGSKEEREAVLNVDNHVGSLISGLHKLGLDEQSNIMVVADHGMVNLADERLINLDEIVDLSALQVADWTNRHTPQYAPFFALYGDQALIEQTYAQLSAYIAARTSTGLQPHFQVMRRGEFPPNYHLDHPDRGPDLIIMADVAWSLFASADKSQALPMAHTGRSVATHGYSNLDPRMHATFIAAGPEFKQSPVIEAFENIEVYGLATCILGIKPAATDGDIARVQHLLRKNCPHN